jgi:hypothetical protein
MSLPLSPGQPGSHPASGHIRKNFHIVPMKGSYFYLYWDLNPNRKLFLWKRLMKMGPLLILYPKKNYKLCIFSSDVPYSKIPSGQIRSA